MKALLVRLYYYRAIIFVTCFVFIVYTSFNYAPENLLEFYSNTNSFLKKLGNNWGKGLVTDIKLEKTPCSGEYENALNDIFPGIDDSCKCDINGNVSQKKGFCSTVFFEKQVETTKCKDISGTSPMKYAKWKGWYICVKRTNNTYFDLKKHISKRSCRPEHKPCGILDTTGMKLCIDSNVGSNSMSVSMAEEKPIENCPINFFKLIDISEESKEEYSGKQKLKIDDTHVLVFSNDNPNGNLFNTFKVSYGKPCIDPSLENTKKEHWELSREYENYLKCDTSSETLKPLIDPKYVELDTWNFYDLYKDNTIYEGVKDFPGYSETDLKGTIATLFVKNYNSVDQACLKFKPDLQESDFVATLTGLGSHSGAKSYIFVIQTLNYVEMLILLFLIGIIILQKLYPSTNFQNRRCSYYSILSYFIVIVVYLKSILMFIQISNCSKNKKLMEVVEGCFLDKLMNNVFYNYYGYVKNFYDIHVTLLVYDIIISFVMIIFIVLDYFYYATESSDSVVGLKEERDFRELIEIEEVDGKVEEERKIENENVSDQDRTGNENPRSFIRLNRAEEIFR